MDGEARGNQVWARWRERLRPWRQRAVLIGRQAARQAGPALRAFWRVAKPVLRTALQIFLALIIVLEEWGWRPLADLLGRLARWQPWAQLESGIARLPPYVALFVFVLPSTLLLPLKFFALFLIARGQVVLAAMLFALAKVVATALVARLFMLTQPALMQIGWFAWCYDHFMPWKEALTDYVRGTWPWRVGRVWKERARKMVMAQWRIWRPTLLQLRGLLKTAAEKIGAQVRRLVQEARTRWAARQR
jgi:hypothetical protein